MVDFKTLKSISAIQGAQENGKDIFTREEKLIFATSSLIAGDVEKAQKVAKLLVKIKQANETFKEDINLHDEIEKERKSNSIAYQVLQSHDDMVTDALAHLERFYGDEGTTGKTEAQLQEQINAWKVDRKNKEKLRGNKYSQKKVAKKEQEQKAKTLTNKRKSLAKRHAILSILKWDGTTGSDTDVEIEVKGVKTKLSALPAPNATTNQVRDYDNTYLWDSNPHYYANTDGFSPLVLKARSYLNGMAAIKVTIPPTYFETKAGNTWNQRKYNCKNNISTEEEAIGQSYLKLLRNIGIDKLKAVIDASGATNKDDLKKYVEKMIKYINNYEAITKVVDYKWESSEKHAKLYDAFQRNLLNAKNDEYPYEPVPNWKKFFELMVKVFPRSGKLYLDDQTDPNYIKPDLSRKGKGGLEPSDDKKGWKNFLIDGYCENLPNPGTGVGQNLSLYRYAQEHATDKPLLKKHADESHEIQTNLNFKALTGIWWDVFEGTFNTSTFEWDTSKVGADMTTDERDLEKSRKCLRFAKTMREILKAVNVTDSIDELDYLLLEVADKAEKGSWINPRDKILELKVQKPDYDADSMRKAVSLNKIWTDVAATGSSPIDFELLNDLVLKDESDIGMIEIEIKRINDQISQLSNEENELQIAINDLDANILSFTQGLEQFKKDPVDKNKEDFETLWNKKDGQNGKWTRSQIELLRGYIKILKNKLSPTDFASGDYDSKDKTLENIEKEYAKFTNDYFRYLGFGATDVERVTKIIAEKNKLDFTLQKAQTAYEGLAGHIKLEDWEQNSLANIKEGISNPGKFKNESNLDGPKINAALGTSTTISDADIKLNDWKSLAKFNTEQEIKNLVAKVKSDTTNYAKFQDHLANHTFGSAKTAKDANQWTNFVKKGPKIVIGEILYWADYENASDSAKQEIINAIKKVNELDEADKSDLWSTDDKTDEGRKAITKYLYRKAFGRAFEAKTKVTPNPKESGGDDKDKGVLAHLKKHWIPYSAVGIVIAAAIGAAIYFWEDIKGWFGTSEENTDKVEENE